MAARTGRSAALSIADYNRATSDEMRQRAAQGRNQTSMLWPDQITRRTLAGETGTGDRVKDARGHTA
jgi:hypothetical protein